jgi:hypothetical protein
MESPRVNQPRIKAQVKKCENFKIPPSIVNEIRGWGKSGTTKKKLTGQPDSGVIGEEVKAMD